MGAGSATSTEDSKLTASVLDNADLEAAGTLRISSASDVNVFANVDAGSGSVGVTVDAPSATATTNTAEQAYVAGYQYQATLSGQDITIASGGMLTEPDKKSRVHTKAEINGGSGAGLVGVSTGTAKAFDNASLDAHVLGHVVATASGGVFINTLATSATESSIINGGSGAGVVNVESETVTATAGSQLKAYVSGPAVQITTGGTLQVSAQSGDVAMVSNGEFVDGLAVSALIEGGSGAGGVNVDTTTVTATDNSSLTADVQDGVVVRVPSDEVAFIGARGGVEVDSGYRGGSGAGVFNVGTPKSTATANSAFNAYVDGKSGAVDIRAGGLDLAAGDGGNKVTVSSSLNGGDGGGIASVSDTDATATDNSSFKAYVGANSGIDVGGNGDFSLQAISSSDVSASLSQDSGAGVVNVHSPTVTATDTATRKAYVDATLGPAAIQAGNIVIEAGSGSDGLLADAGFHGGGGGGIVGVGTTTAKAEHSADIEAYVSGVATLTATGTLQILASTGDIVSNANVSNTSGGALVNVDDVTATASNDSTMYAKVETMSGVPSLTAHDLLVWAGTTRRNGSLHPAYVNLQAVIGTSGGSAISVSNPTATAHDQMQLEALLGGIVTTVGNIDVKASTQTVLEANPLAYTDGVLSGDQGGTATATRDGSTIAKIASDCGSYCGAITAGGDVSITAEEVNQLTTDVGAGSGAFVATAHGMSTSTVKSTVKAVVGPTESVIAAGDVSVLAQMVPLCPNHQCQRLGVESGELTANAYTTASGAGSGSITIARAELSPEIDAIIGEDSLVRSGQAVSVKALLSGTNLYSNTFTNLNAAFTTLFLSAHSYMDSRVSTELRSGSTIIAPGGVTARAVQDQVSAQADANKTGHAIDGGTIESLADPKMYSKIDFQATASIYAYNVDFESNIELSTVSATESDNDISGTFKITEAKRSDPLSDVIVNGDIYMLNAVPQHLVIHPDGTIETVSGEITAKAVGDTIVVAPLVNDRVGTIRLVAQAPMNDEDKNLLMGGYSQGKCPYDPTRCSDLGWNSYKLLYSGLKNGRIRGTTGTVHYANAYPYVLIENYSPKDLVVNNIIMSTPGTATPTITLESDNSSDPSYQSWVTTQQDLSSNLQATFPNGYNGTYDGLIPSRYYVVSPDTTTVDNVPDALVNPDSSIISKADHLQITGTNGDSTIRIFSTTGANTDFQGLVDSEGRSGSIGIFNESGNITASGSDAAFRTHAFKAYAYGGSIGTASAPLPVQLVPFNDQVPSLTAFAQGSIYLKTVVTDSTGSLIDGGTATIGNVTAGNEAHLTFDEAPDNYNIVGNLFGLNSLEVHVVDPSVTTLDITGSLESGVENYHFTVNSDTLAPGGAWVNVDLSNVDIAAPSPGLAHHESHDVTYDVAVDRYTSAIYLYIPGFAETNQPGASARQYNEGDLIGFKWSQNAGQVTFDSPIKHIPGEIRFTEGGSGNIQITGSGTLSQLNGYSKVYIDNLSGRSLQTALIDIDQAVLSADHRSIATSTTPLTTKSDIETAYPGLQVSDFGSSEGLVDIQARSPSPTEPYGIGGYDTLLGGDILNSSGLTHIRNEQGGIYQTDGGKVIQSRQIELRAWDYTGPGTGIIGTAAQPIRTALQGGTLDALAYGGGIHVKEISGDLNLLRAQSIGGFGDVSLSAYDSIVDSNGGALNILGKDVTLTATLGHIDTDLSSTGVVTASATGTGGAPSGTSTCVPRRRSSSPRYRPTITSASTPRVRSPMPPIRCSASTGMPASARTAMRSRSATGPPMS